MSTPVLPRRDALLLAAGAFLSGCVPGYVVRRQANADPFAGQRRFKLTPLDTSAALKVIDVRADQPEVERHAKLMAYGIGGLIGGFRRGLLECLGSDFTITEAKPEPSAFLVEPRVLEVVSGIYENAPGRTYRARSQVVLNVRFTAPGGEFDEIQAQSSTMAGGILFDTPEARLDNDGYHCGYAAGAHLKKRVEG